MDELGRLSKLYFRLEKVEDEKESNNMKRLFEYIYFLKPPKKFEITVPYDVMLEIAKIVPEKNQLDFAVEKLKGFGHVKKPSKSIDEEVKNLLEFAKNWVRDFERKEIVKIELSKEEKNAISELVGIIKIEDDAEVLQKRIFDITDKHKIKPKRFFQIIYTILLNSERGPRLGQYILQVGKDEIIKKLNEAL